MASLRGGRPDRYGLMSVNMRITPECYDFLVDLSKSEHRSLGAQCALMIERAADSLQNQTTTKTPNQT